MTLWFSPIPEQNVILNESVDSQITFFEFIVDLAAAVHDRSGYMH